MQKRPGVVRMPKGIISSVAGFAGLAGLLLLSGCQFLPPELRTLKAPIRLSPFRHEVTIQPSRGMGPAPFTVDQARAKAAEVQLTLSNPTTSTIRVVWGEGTFITADSLAYAIGVKTEGGEPSTRPTLIEANSTVRVTVIAVAKDGKSVTPDDKSIDAPYRVGLKLTAEQGITSWKGTVWVFVL